VKFLLKFEKKVMALSGNAFNSIVDTIYSLPLEEKQELKDLLEHHIADERRNEIALNYKKALAEQEAGKLKFSSSINELKKML
jgi:hypothetical protein